MAGNKLLTSTNLYGVMMAKLIGSSSDDELHGSSLNDLFNASAGNDLFLGSDGIDRAVYKENISKYIIKYLNGSIYVVKPDNSVDELQDIEQIQFGSEVFQLTEDHLTDAIGDTRPIDLMFSREAKTYFLSTSFTSSNLLNLDILQADCVTKNRLFLPRSFSISAAKVFQSDDGGVFVVTAGAGRLSIAKINDDGSETLMQELNLANTSFVDSLSILSIDSEKLTLALSLWNGSAHVSQTYEVNSFRQDPNFSLLNQIDVGYGHGAFQLSNGTQAHIYVGLGPVKTEPIWGGGYYDTEVLMKILNADGTELFTKTLGGNEHITETYRTSLVTRDEKIVAGWIGLAYVLDENGGMSGGANGVRVRQEGYFYGAIIDPNEPDSLVKFLINQNPEDNAMWSTSCELTGGELVFVWASNADGSGLGVYARIFDADGNALTDQFQVNSRTWDNQTSPIVVADKSGGFTVFWNDSYYGGAFQRFDNQGNPNLIALTGTSKADIIFADDGDQQIIGGNGDDQISSGMGDDILLGGAGNDVLKPGVGNDIISGGIGINTVDYSNLTASINLSLDTGSVTYDIFEQTLSGIQNVIATQFDDVITGSSVANTIKGAAGNDFILGLAGSDSLYGEAGDDTLNGGADADILIGGLGNDIYVVDNANDTVTEKSGEGIDTIQTTLSTFSLGKLSAFDNLTYTGVSPATLTGNALSNIITGSNGSDKIDGFLGADTLIGGQGDDYFIVDNALDVVAENTDEGTDSVTSSVTYTLSDNVEKLMLTGAKAINGTGNALDNVIVGNAKANTLIGDNGSDTLDGGAASDYLTGGSGADLFKFTTALGKTNIDTITDFVSGTDKIQLDDAVFKKFLGDSDLGDNFVSTSETAGAFAYLIARSVGNDTVIFYDEDGSGKSAAVKFAVLVGVTDLNASDFLVI